MTLSIALVADGDPSKSSTNSGVALGLLMALRARADVRIVGLIDSTDAPPLQVWLNRLLSFHPNRTMWQNKTRKGRRATLIRSRVRDRALSSLAETPDVVVHVRNTYRPTTLPYVVFIDGTSSLSQRYWHQWRMPRRAYRQRFAEEQKFFSHAGLIATAGSHVAEEVVSAYGVHGSRVAAVGGGNNYPVTVHSRANAKKSFRILFVGAEFERKGGHTLLKAFEMVQRTLPRSELVIVGPPAGAPQMGVRWLGRVTDREELSELYQESALFCLPSIYEPYGLAVQEALAHGMPCVVSERGALPDIVGEAGVAVPAGSESALASALIDLLQDPDRLDKLSDAAISQAQSLTWDAVADRLLMAYPRKG